MRCPATKLLGVGAYSRRVAFRPTWQLLRPMRWELDPERDEVRFFDDATGTTRLRGWTATLLELIQQGAGFDSLVDALGPLFPRFTDEQRGHQVRRFVYNMHRLGYLEIALPRPGSFQGRYTVRKELGRGGVGVAYLCDDAQTGERVVVKRAWEYFQPLSVTDPLVRHEAAIMGRFDHPGVARMFGSFEEDGRFHLVREFVQGRELALFREGGVKDVAARRTIARGIADVLAHLHERGFLALDMRPANWYVTDAWMPRLIDVGHCIAHTDGVVQLEKRHGSGGFTSPEMIASFRGTRASDVWGLGRLMFFMATGGLPKDKEAAADLVARMPAVPEGERALIARLAADDPADRPESAAAARELLG